MNQLARMASRRNSKTYALIARTKNINRDQIQLQEFREMIVVLGSESKFQLRKCEGKFLRKSNMTS